VSEHLIAALRRTDVAGRYGGEEIIVVMPQSDLDGAAMLADRWRCGIEEASFEVPDGRNAPVTVSIGVASFDPSLETPEDLIAVADSALYRAKENGRNRVEVKR
jgi:diguanylate cyclase (GGDEF)-like protein